MAAVLLQQSRTRIYGMNASFCNATCPAVATPLSPEIPVDNNMPSDGSSEDNSDEIGDFTYDVPATGGEFEFDAQLLDDAGAEGTDSTMVLPPIALNETATVTVVVPVMPSVNSSTSSRRRRGDSFVKSC
jgi:hypothetical protein